MGKHTDKRKNSGKGIAWLMPREQWISTSDIKEKLNNKTFRFCAMVIMLGLLVNSTFYAITGEWKLLLNAVTFGLTAFSYASYLYYTSISVVLYMIVMLIGVVVTGGIEGSTSEICVLCIAIIVDLFIKNRKVHKVSMTYCAIVLLTIGMVCMRVQMSRLSMYDVSRGLKEIASAAVILPVFILIGYVSRTNIVNHLLFLYGVVYITEATMLYRINAGGIDIFTNGAVLVVIGFMTLADSFKLCNEGSDKKKKINKGIDKEKE